MHRNKEIVLSIFGAEECQFDAHFHLSWIKNLAEYFDELRACRLKVFANTVTPADYEELLQRLHNGDDELYVHNGDDELCVRNGDDELVKVELVKVGLGLHPWYVENADIERFEQLCRMTDFIGEIGLDFSKRFSGNQKYAQVAEFERVARAISETATSAENPKILSIHSCKTAGRTHEILSKAGCLNNCILIYHWFNDDFATLQKCIKDGCLFSVNERMLATKNGAEIARQVPRGQLLFETDWPVKRGDAISAKDELAAIIYAWEKSTKTENATSK